MPTVVCASTIRSQMRLTDEQVRRVLARAEEIGDAQLPSAINAEIDAVVEAGMAVGLPRAALERALREELNLPARSPVTGDLVFARSTDERYYAAEVLSVAREELPVRFLRGGEHSVTPDEVRPCRFLPGERVVVNWPWWGEWTCTVESHDAERQEVTVSDGWDSSKAFPIAEVWLARRKKSVSFGGGRDVRPILMRVAGLGATSLVTAFVIWLLMR